MPVDRQVIAGWGATSRKFSDRRSLSRQRASAAARRRGGAAARRPGGPGRDPPGLAGLRCGQGAWGLGAAGAGTWLKPAGTVTFSLARFAGVGASQWKSVWRCHRFARTGR